MCVRGGRHTYIYIYIYIYANHQFEQEQPNDQQQDDQVTELTNEIHALQTEHKHHERSMNEYGGLQKRHEILLNEVRALEGTLADYNLAMDKARVSTPPCHTVSSGP